MISPLYCGVGVGVVDGSCGGVCGTTVTCDSDRAAAFSAAAITGELPETLATAAAASTAGSAGRAGVPATVIAAAGFWTIAGLSTVSVTTAVSNGGAPGRPATPFCGAAAPLPKKKTKISPPTVLEARTGVTA